MSLGVAISSQMGWLQTLEWNHQNLQDLRSVYYRCNKTLVQQFLQNPHYPPGAIQNPHDWRGWQVAPCRMTCGFRPCERLFADVAGWVFQSPPWSSRISPRFAGSFQSFATSKKKMRQLVEWDMRTGNGAFEDVIERRRDGFLAQEHTSWSRAKHQVHVYNIPGPLQDTCKRCLCWVVGACDL